MARAEINVNAHVTVDVATQQLANILRVWREGKTWERSGAESTFVALAEAIEGAIAAVADAPGRCPCGVPLLPGICGARGFACPGRELHTHGCRMPAGHDGPHWQAQ